MLCMHLWAVTFIILYISSDQPALTLCSDRYVRYVRQTNIDLYNSSVYTTHIVFSV